jgi:hypothetical protein
LCCTGRECLQPKRHNSRLREHDACTRAHLTSHGRCSTVTQGFCPALPILTQLSHSMCSFRRRKQRRRESRGEPKILRPACVALVESNQKCAYFAAQITPSLLQHQNVMLYQYGQPPTLAQHKSHRFQGAPGPRESNEALEA